MHMGLGVRSVATTRTFSQGTPLETGKAYDVAINGATNPSGPPCTVTFGLPIAADPCSPG